MRRRDINAADAPAPAGQYTQAVEVTGASRTLYISGQVGIASDGSIPEDAEAQCALAWRSMRVHPDSSRGYLASEPQAVMRYGFDATTI